MTRLSIVISTFNRAAVLHDVLADLAAQQGAPAFEVVIIDDGSSDDTSAVVTAAQQSSPSGPAIRYHHQSNQGLAAARNTGAALSSGSIVAFLDDDVVVPPGWVAAVCAAFEDPTVAAIGGRIDLRFECPVPPWFVPQMRDYLGELRRGDEPHRLEYPEFPFGGHCAIRSDVWGQIGELDTQFGYKAGTLVPNEERELFRRMGAAGLAVWYWPAATVEHRIGAGRLTKEWFRRRVHGQGIADGVMDFDRADPAPATLVREAIRVARALPILLRSIPRGNGPFSAELWLRYCSGRWSSLRAARRRQRGASTTA